MVSSSYPYLAPSAPIYSGPQGFPNQPRPPRRVSVAAAVVGAAAIALVAGGIGGLIGNRMATTPSAQPTVAAPTTPPAPTAEQVHTATVDLCTRFAAGYHAMPSPQNTASDVIPSYNYISEALRDNPAADSAIRDAITNSLRLARDQASKLTNEPARGAIQPATGWTADVANPADQRVWDLCRAYGG